MSIALAERDGAGRDDGASAPASPQRDVRPLPERVEEVAVLLPPGASLIPADEGEPGLRALPGQAIEPRDVAVDPGGDASQRGGRGAGLEASNGEDRKRESN